MGRDLRYERLVGLRRGDVVTVALHGDQGKPGPALVVQANLYAELGSVTVLPITSTLTEAPLLRVRITPDGQNGLVTRSDVMVDKPQIPGRNRLGAVIGHLDEATMIAVNRGLAVFLGLA